MKFSILKVLFHSVIILLLTIITQIGGIVYAIAFFLFPKNKSKYKIKRILFFLTLYLIATFLLTPNIAPLFGRVKVTDNYTIQSQNNFIKICNRNYTTVKMNAVLMNVALQLNKEFPNLKLTYLDANFPFYDGFPLLHI